ncbi:MAG: YCF48-related protein, partial [Gammaproteobacteria bacterium]|nr:YCF48-related protein [Gammaproteobacteria bacterium]
MSARVVKMLLASAVWLLAPGHASAGNAPQWAATEGPFGGTVQALQTLPDGSVIAGTLNGGVFYRRSLQSSWQRADWPLAVADVRGFATDGDTLYAVSNGGGIAASRDAGLSWEPLNTRSFETELAAVAVRGNFILIGARRGVLLRSYDAGVSWQRIRIRQTRTAISAIHITDDTVWVATNGGGVFVSHDRALSFRPRLAGLRNRNALSLARLGDAVIVGTRAGVYRFEQNSWQPIGKFARRLPVVSLLVMDDELFAG